MEGRRCRARAQGEGAAPGSVADRAARGAPGMLEHGGYSWPGSGRSDGAASCGRWRAGTRAAGAMMPCSALFRNQGRE